MESYLAGLILLEKDGRERLVKFLRVLPEGEEVEEALARTFGEDTASLEDEIKGSALSKDKK